MANPRFLMLALVLLPSAIFSQDRKESVRRIDPSGLSMPHGYAQVVLVERGRTVYIAGQIPLDKDGKLVGAGDFGAQARQTFQNLKIALAAVGLTFADVVSMNTYVTDMSQLDKYRQISSEYVTSEPPAATLVEVTALPEPEAMIEVSAIAVARK
jgi:enamine deaminase RidA (YjgF/YER057c/UK114 family)